MKALGKHRHKRGRKCALGEQPPEHVRDDKGLKPCISHAVCTQNARENHLARHPGNTADKGEGPDGPHVFEQAHGNKFMRRAATKARC